MQQVNILKEDIIDYYLLLNAFLHRIRDIDHINFGYMPIHEVYHASKTINKFEIERQK